MNRRLLIADDHPLFRAGLALGLSALGFDVVAEAGDGAQAVALCREHQPDVALLDAKMPVMDGVAACREIRRAQPEVRVVLLTTFTEAALVTAARDAGAAGFLSKEAEAPHVAATLRRILADPHERVFPTVDMPSFTGRELQVLGHLSKGLSNKEIARALKLSPETVKDHVMNLYRKLEVNDRVAAVGRARTLGLV